MSRVVVLPGKVDSANEELLAFIDIERQVDLVCARERLRLRLGHHIDEAELAIQLPKVLHAFAKLSSREDIAFRHLEQRSHQRIRSLEQLDAHEIDLVQTEQLAFVYMQFDVGSLAGFIRLEQRNPDPALIAADVANGHLGIADSGSEVSVLLIEVADHLFIDFELAPVEALGEEVFKDNRVRDSDRAQVAHRAPDHTIGENAVAFDLDLPDLDLRTFIDLENDFE